MVKCPICGEEFPDKKALLEHIKKEHPKEYYEAFRLADARDKGKEYTPELENETETPETKKLEETKPKSEPENKENKPQLPPVKWVCPACGKEFASRGALVGHLLTAHKEYQ